jgi:hypothetical protein
MFQGGQGLWQAHLRIPPPDILLAYLPAKTRPLCIIEHRSLKNPALKGEACPVVARKDLGEPHPRAYGTFPRVIAKYVREKKLITLEEAVRKMTSLPARKLGLWDRGLIRPGMKADLVIFNFWRIEDTATYENPLVPRLIIADIPLFGVALLPDPQGF